MSSGIINQVESTPDGLRRWLSRAAIGVICGVLVGLVLVLGQLVSAFRQIVENRYLQQKMFRLTGFILQDALLKWLLVTLIFALAGLLLSSVLPRRWLNQMGRTVFSSPTIRNFMNRSSPSGSHGRS